jgi:uncharacterized protein YndB with AHSA1/START domain
LARNSSLIRRPVADVLEAFVNPDITTTFWFTNSSGKLEAGKRFTGSGRCVEATRLRLQLMCGLVRRTDANRGEPR